MEVTGKASHAGVAPEKGISATLVPPSRSLRPTEGWFGKVVKSDGTGPAMSGSLVARRPPAGDATNVVTDYAFIKGEARSPRRPLQPRSRRLQAVVRKAQAPVTDADGATAKVVPPNPSYPRSSSMKRARRRRATGGEYWA